LKGPHLSSRRLSATRVTPPAERKGGPTAPRTATTKTGATPPAPAAPQRAAWAGQTRGPRQVPQQLDPNGPEAARFKDAQNAANEPKLPNLKDRDIKGKTHWGEAKGPLFEDKLGPDDFVQGKLGDCYFLSSVASLAQRHPEVLRDAIHANPDGTFDVRFFRIQKNGPPTEIHVMVDDEIPEDGDGKPLFASARDNQEVWPLILEKGYAAFRKGYNEVDKGAHPGEALTELTGKPAVESKIEPKTADAVFTQLKDAIAQGKPTCASIQSLPNRLDMYRKLLAPAGVSAANIDKTLGVRNAHAYTVLGVSEENGQKFVTVRDPWGEVGWEHEQASHGELKLPLAEFSAIFDLLSIGDV
jgi:calpain family cysteine protease